MTQIFKVCYGRSESKTSTITAPFYGVVSFGEVECIVLEYRKNYLLHIPVNNILWLQTKKMKMQNPVSAELMIQ